MRNIHLGLNFLIAAGIGLTLLTVGNLYAGVIQHGFAGGEGAKMLSLTLYGTIITGLTFAASAIAHLMARNVNPPSQHLTLAGFIVSITAILAILAAPYL